MKELVFKKCCCCFPLRYGLLVWAYLRLIICFCFLGLFLWEKDIILSDSTSTFVVILLCKLLYIAINILLVVGVHMKNLCLMAVTFLFNSAALFVYCIIYLKILTWRTSQTTIEYIGDIVDIASEIYFLVLVKSEIIKLENLNNSSVNNNAAEGETIIDTQDEHIKTPPKDDSDKIPAVVYVVNEKGDIFKSIRTK